MPSPTIDVVCFDLGGVLLRICRSWREACETVGLPIRGTWPNGEPHVAGWPELRKGLQTGALDRDTYVARLSAAMNNLYSPGELVRLHTGWCLDEYPGVCDIIDRIHAAGRTTACLSNTDHAHWEQILVYPVIKKLHHLHASHLLRLQKPDAAIYREFERHMNLSETGNRILFFDDLEENIAAARACGWNAVQIDHAGDTAAQMTAALDQFHIAR